MTTMTAPLPMIRLSSSDREILERAIELGYLCDDQYGSAVSRAFTEWCWIHDEPLVVFVPWRRHWLAGQVTLPLGQYLNRRGLASANEALRDALAEPFQVCVPFLPSGALIRGLRPEAVARFAEVILSVCADPGLTTHDEISLQSA